MEKTPLVGLIMGSTSDWSTLEHTANTLDALEVPYEVRVVSAHRTPDLLFAYAANAEARGLQIIIAGAGGAAHLPGMAASKTILPVLGVPVQSQALNGLDSLLSIVQMPGGVPVGTLAIGKAGAINAALLAAAMLGHQYPAIREAVRVFRDQQTANVLNQPDPPEQRTVNVGIVGGGQLARMLALAGYPLGLRFQILDPAADACAGQVAPLIQGDYDDPAQLARLADWADVVTFDFENVPAVAAQTLAERVGFYPPAEALARAQDRLSEKTLFWELGIPTPNFTTIDSLEELQDAVTRMSLPAVLKTRRLGYDGKGQRILRIPEDIEAAWRALGGVPLILESFVPFEREVSVLAIRCRDGATAFYPLVENYHREGILRLSRAPCLMPKLEQEGWDYAHRLLDRLNYVGLLAIEFFVQAGRLIANEMAPRVHNSGHWTIEGAETSQFENHLRAILGLSLGSTTAIGHSVMLNAIGDLPERSAVLALPNAHYHDYGKASRPGRKVGHITLRGDDPDAVWKELQQLLPRVGFEPEEFG